MSSVRKTTREKKRTRRPAYHHGDLRQALVAAALHALTRQDAADLSLRAVGRALGVSPRAPYRHFETKEALLAAVAIEGFARFGAFVERRLASAGLDPVERLRAVAEAYVLFAVEQPAAFRVMYAPYATVNERSPDLLRARGAAHCSRHYSVPRAWSMRRRSCRRPSCRRRCLRSYRRLRPRCR